MQKQLKILLVLVIFAYTLDATAESLKCKTSFLTTSDKLLSSPKLHDQAKHPQSDFFSFTVGDNRDTELYVYQNICIQGKDIKDRRLKGFLCLHVTAGAKTLSELGYSEDPYLSETSDVITFNVFHMGKDRSLLNSKIYFEASSEMAVPLTSFRGTFRGNGGGLGSVTITCTNE